ncbi:sensor domain-containing protein, partial [Mycobacterium timonense]
MGSAQANKQSKAQRVSKLPRTLIAAARAAAITGSAAMVVAACSHPNTPVSSSSKPTPAITADSLIVTLGEVRRITGVDTLASPPDSEVHQPRHFKSDLPFACQSVFDQQTAFGDGWKQFDTATYFADTYTGDGPTKVRGMADIGQAVAVYPDEASAHTAFDRVVSQLTACSALHLPRYEFAMDKSDPSAVTLNNNGWTVIYRIKSSVLI